MKRSQAEDQGGKTVWDLAAPSPALIPRSCHSRSKGKITGSEAGVCTWVITGDSPSIPEKDLQLKFTAYFPPAGDGSYKVRHNLAGRHYGRRV